MPESIIPTGLSLDKALILLNKFILQADKYGRLQEDKTLKDPSGARHFQQQFDSFKKNMLKNNWSDEDIFEGLKQLISTFGSHYKTTSGMRIFKAEKKIEPVYGIGDASVPYFNEQLVIGAKCTLYDDSMVSYRVDFDHKAKGLHINFDLIFKNKQFHKEVHYALCIKPDSKRYKVSMADVADLSELMQFKFFAKMTLDYLSINPQKIQLAQKSAASSLFLAPGCYNNKEINLLNFLQQKPFYFAQLADYLISCIKKQYDSKSVQEVEVLLKACKSKQDLVSLLKQEKRLRHAIVDMGAILFNKAAIEIKLRLEEEHCSVDSEDRSRSECSLGST